MDPRILIGKWFWVLCFPVAFINAAVFWIRASKHINHNPELETGYKKLILGFIIWMLFPWIIMGIGCTIGEIPSVFYFFKLRDGNPYVIAWFIAILFEIIITTYWLYFKGGAEMLIKHPGLFNTEPASAATIKFWWLLMLIVPILGMIVMVLLDIPVPSFN